MNTYDKIPKNLIDKNTILEKDHPKWLPEHHTQFTYLFCIILRILLGVIIYQNLISTNIIIIICLLILIGFGSKYFNILDNKITIWKNYQRVVILYSISLLSQISNIKNKNQLTGLLIIIDAILGQQSRYITTNMSRSAPL